MANTQEKPLLRGIDPTQLSRAAETIKLLGHPERLKIVVSQHLAKLRGLGIVAAQRDGVHVYYKVMEPKVRHILECIRKCDV